VLLIIRSAVTLIFVSIIGNTVENNLRAHGNEQVIVALNTVNNVLDVSRNLRATVKKNDALTLIRRRNIVLDQTRMALT
jgi:hypothetical protein